MSKWMFAAGRWLLLGLLLVSMGGHLVLMQTVAWSRMLADFSSQSSFKEAVAKTFDGEHPCAMCKVVKKSKSEEDKKAPLLKAEMKMEIALAPAVTVPAPKFIDCEPAATAYSGRYGEVYLALPMQPPRGI